MSIDEAFLDMTRTRNLFGPPEESAKRLKERVKEETGLTVSIGAAGNKYVAKIASGMSKPDGLFVIPPGGEAGFMRNLPVDKIWGAGPKAQEQFRRHGFATCADILPFSIDALQASFGNAFGTFLYKAVRGEAAEDFDAEARSHSISTERTFDYDLYDMAAIESNLFEMCENLMDRLIETKQRARTVYLKIRYGDFSTESIQQSSDMSVLTVNELYGRALNLFNNKYKKGPGDASPGLRLLGCGLGGIEDASLPYKAELWEDPKREKERKLEEAVLNINKRFPDALLHRARV
jgi:DNA polymerase-4